MAAPDGDDLDSIRARLTELGAARSALIERLQQLQALLGPGGTLPTARASITGESSATEKIALFRRLFSGRTDVSPILWEKRNTGKSGYAPACSNEWVIRLAVIILAIWAGSRHFATHVLKMRSQLHTKKSRCAAQQARRAGGGPRKVYGRRKTSPKSSAESPNGLYFREGRGSVPDSPV
jgi:hypothetical protein